MGTLGADGCQRCRGAGYDEDCVCVCDKSHTPSLMMWKWIGTASTREELERQVKPVFQKDGSQFIISLLYLHTCSARMSLASTKRKDYEQDPEGGVVDVGA